MRILFLTSISPFDELTGPVAAGAEMAMRCIAETLAARGHRVHYLTMSDLPERTTEVNGVHVHLVSRQRSRKAQSSWLGRRIVTRLDSRLSRGRRRGRKWRDVGERLRDFAIREGHADWRLKDKLYEIVGTHGIELLHTYSSLPDSLVGAITASELQIPVVLRMGGRFWYLQHGRIAQAKKAAYLNQLRYVFDTVDTLAFNSVVLQEQTEALFAELEIRPPRDQLVLDIGVRIPTDCAEAADPTDGQGTDGQFLLSCVGKFKRDSKRQDLVVQAVKLLGDEFPVHAVFAGDGPTKEQVEALAEREGVADRTSFVGDMPHGSVLRLLERSEIVLHPTEFEGASKVVAEAMMCGKAVIASDIPALRETIEDGVTGLLAENSAEGFAERIRRLARDEPLRHRLGKNARDYAVREFDPDRNIERYEELFRSVVNRSRRRPRHSESILSRFVETLDLARRRVPQEVQRRKATLANWRVVERLGLGRRLPAGGKLAYYWKAAGSGFWDEHWVGHQNEQRYVRAESGNLGEYEELFDKYLPREGRILEAGCGPGHLVLALRARGWDCEGVDFGAETIASALEARPGLPLSRGDVKNLDVPDGHYAGYISLGVVEHDFDGPGEFLAEAHRILAPGGVAVVSVPYYHLLRRLKSAGFLLRGKIGDDLRFYQYAYGRRAISAHLRAAGFRILAVTRANAVKGLADELPLLKDALSRASYATPLKKRIQESKMLNRLFGHKIMIVCRKVAAGG